MTLVVIFGPAAVGKMTVGMELERLTGMRLNETPLRLAEKKPKRDLANSRVHLLDADRRYQLNTQGGINSGAQLYGGSFYGYSIDQLFGPSKAGQSYASPFYPTSWDAAGINYFSPFIVPDRLSFDSQTVNYFRGNAGLRGQLR